MHLATDLLAQQQAQVSKSAQLTMQRPERRAHDTRQLAHMQKLAGCRNKALNMLERSTDPLRST